jgi:GT2 family glycosyltransferase
VPHCRIDLIVPIYKNADLVKACVDSLIRHLPEIAESRPRLVLVNDSPDDADVEHLLQTYSAAPAELMVLRNDTNQGFVRSVNRGIAQAVADGHDVLLVNSDTQTFAGTLANLLAAARRPANRLCKPTFEQRLDLFAAALFWRPAAHA